MFQKRQNNIIKFTQKELAQKFGFSLSTIFNALKPLRQASIVSVTGRFFILNDYKKLLYLWASSRNPKKNVYYRSFTGWDTAETEGVMPPEVIFGAYSGFKILYKNIPAEYDHIYVYLEKANLAKLVERISDSAYSANLGQASSSQADSASINQNKSYYNLFVLEPDPWFRKYSQPMPEQIFVDIWNASEWYAKDFLKALEEKL